MVKVEGKRLRYEFVTCSLYKVRYELLSLASECRDYDQFKSIMDLLISLFQDKYFKKLWVLVYSDFMNEYTSNELKESLDVELFKDIDNRYHDLLKVGGMEHYFELKASGASIPDYRYNISKFY